MGNCTSTKSHSHFTSPSIVTIGLPTHGSSSSPPYCPITLIVVHSPPIPINYPPTWLFEYRLNLGPITIGQRVELHLRVEDCFDKDPVPVAEGWINRIADYTPYWLTFQITDIEGKDLALLGIPYALLISPIDIPLTLSLV